MQSAGYRTGFVGKYHLENETLLPKFGGDGTSVFEPEADAWLKKRAPLAHRANSRAWLRLRLQSARLSQLTIQGNRLRQCEAQHGGRDTRTLRFLDENSDRPFFLYFSTHLLHLPIDPKLLTQDYAKYGRVTEGGLLDKRRKCR